MFLTSDYHTHTKYSHGKGRVIDNALAAQKAGLKEIAISDHGFSHPAFGLTARKLDKIRADCDKATIETGIKVLLGIESNIIGVDGQVDLTKERYDYFDSFSAGIHKLVKFKLNTFFPLAIPDLIKSMGKNPKISDKLRKTNTKTFINVIKNNPVDIITHLNFCCFADAVEVAKAAADYGTYLELNAKKVHLSDQEISDILAKTDVKFVIGSDAHSPNRVGEISLVEKMIDRLSFPKDRIMNIDGKIPDFRFKAFKEGR